MDQLTQKLKNGNMQVLEVASPSLQAGQVLVKNHYSLISAGTETSTVRAARKSYIGKAKERPQQVKQVFDTLRAQGFTQTYRAVMKKLDAYSPLGYSAAGEVIAVGEGVRGFSAGDLVACGGLTASHAEIISVPENLCVRLQPNVDMRQAAYNTLGAIALQGVRQADLRLGEACAVIGMGLLGQLTALLLRASGVRVVGIDIDARMVAIASAHCLDLALRRDDAGIEDKIRQFSGGLGCDAVIITAATPSLDPINFAGAISKKRGTIVIVGAVPTGFDREPHFYKKELQVKMSCSYGPGRYDPAYEEKGIDYPAAYVRWTENRNMQAFQDLLYRGSISVDYLTTHTFTLDQAPTAYDMLIEKSEPFIGLLIEYDRTKSAADGRVQIAAAGAGASAPAAAIGFIGAGSYAQGYLLPNIPQKNEIALEGVMTASGTSSRSVAERFGFDFCTNDEKDILGSDRINTVFIATRHDSHARYVIKALQAGKHVFVEKPLCLTRPELDEITTAYTATQEAPAPGPQLMVGYNRRFSPLTLALKNHFGSGPMAMLYRINAGAIPTESWIQDPVVGGGRIIGEVCHFIDLLTCINGSLPVSVYAAAQATAERLDDIITISLTYRNGSIGTIAYLASGDKGLPKEYIEVFAGGSTAVLDDFRKLTIYSRGKKMVTKLASQDKGQKKELELFFDAVLNGGGPLISFEEIHSCSLVTLKALKSLTSHQAMSL